MSISEFLARLFGLNTKVFCKDCVHFVEKEMSCRSKLTKQTSYITGDTIIAGENVQCTSLNDSGDCGSYVAKIHEGY